MSNFDSTDMGGKQRDFPPTEWTKLQGFKHLSEEDQRVVVGKFYERYWKPVYWFIRKKGHSNEDAKDLTQGFFCDIVIWRDLFVQADKEKGRFRTLLLAALNCYITDQWRKKHARKRAPSNSLQAITDEMVCAIPSHLARLSPDLLFQYQWALDLLDQAIGTAKREYLDKGKQVHWQVFQEKTLDPILKGYKSPSYREICERLDHVSEQQAQSMELRVRRRFGKILLGATEGESDIDDLLDGFSRM